MSHTQRGQNSWNGEWNNLQLLTFTLVRVTLTGTNLVQNVSALHKFCAKIIKCKYLNQQDILLKKKYLIYYYSMYLIEKP